MNKFLEISCKRYAPFDKNRKRFAVDTLLRYRNVLTN